MPFNILSAETTLTLRVVVDRSIVEAFAQDGRAVVTATAYAPAADIGAALIAESGPATVITKLSMGYGMCVE